MKTLDTNTALLRSRLVTPGICVLLAAIVYAVFGQTTGFEFVNYDDGKNVLANAHVSAGLSWQGIAWAFTHHYTDIWRPLTTISHMLDCQVYGFQPRGHHLTNVLLHAPTAILLFLALRQLTGATWRSAFVAAVFAVHPLRVESVAWVSGREDELSGVFFMLALWAYARYAQSPASLVRYFAVIAFFAIGLLCKPTLVTFPFVLLLLDYWPLQRFAEEPGRRRIFSIPLHLIVEKIPLFVLTSCSCAATIFAEKQSVITADKLSFVDRISNALVSYSVYLGEMIYPVHLVILYPHPANNLPVWEVLLATVLLGTISTAVFLWRRSHPYLVVGWLWYLGVLVPMIGLVQIGWESHADRYTYLPQIGLYISIAWMVADLCAATPYRRMIASAAGLLAIVALMWCASAQASYWRNSEILWTHSLEVAPDNAVVENGLGEALVKNGRLDDGISHYRNALEINPTSAEAHYNLGIALQQKGKLDEAIAQYQSTLEIEPASADVRCNLGNALQQKGEMDEAIAQYTKAAEIDPDNVAARSNLGYALQLQGRVDEAIAQYQQALEINPRMLETRLNLGIAFHQKGEMNEALTQFQKAVKIDPRSAKAHNDLGLALLQSGAVDEAIGHFNKALEIEPGYSDARYNLNLALQQKGK